MKRHLAMLLALALTMALAGCAAKDEGKDPNMGKSSKASVIAAASYPEQAPYPDEMGYLDERTGAFDDEAFSKAYDAWRADALRRQLPDEETCDGLRGFFTRSIQPVLSGAGTENKVYSPLNVYLALAMLAEVTDGESRGQLLGLLGAEDVEALRAQAGAIWQASYLDDGAVTSIPASSLWLNQDIQYRQAAMDALATYHHASSYQGEMGSEAYDRALQDWLNAQTGGLLEEQASGIHMDARTVLALASTFYLRAKWAQTFSESATSEEIFHAPGGELTVDFMHRRSARSYYTAEGFTAVSQPLQNCGQMWFLLPDEGTQPEALLADGGAADFILSGGAGADSRYIQVNLSLPKFDVVSDTDLTAALQALGVTDVFSPDTADFSPMAEVEDAVYLSQARHAARVKIDEEGVVAAAFTVIMAAGTAMPPEEEVDFTLDRPFLFAITGTDGLPLFVGIVNCPS